MFFTLFLYRIVNEINKIVLGMELKLKPALTKMLGKKLSRKQ